MFCQNEEFFRTLLSFLAISEMGLDPVPNVCIQVTGWGGSVTLSLYSKHLDFFATPSIILSSILLGYPEFLKQVFSSFNRTNNVSCWLMILLYLSA